MRFWLSIALERTAKILLITSQDSIIYPGQQSDTAKPRTRGIGTGELGPYHVASVELLRESRSINLPFCGGHNCVFPSPASHLPIDAAPYPQFTTTMHLSSTVLATCLVSASLVLARSSLRHRQSQGDGSQGDADGSQGDLGARPPAKFAYPVIDFPNPTETVVFESAYYVQPGEIFDGKMKRYERPEGSCNEQAEVSPQTAFQCPRA